MQEPEQLTLILSSIDLSTKSFENYINRRKPIIVDTLTFFSAVKAAQRPARPANGPLAVFKQKYQTTFQTEVEIISISGVSSAQKKHKLENSYHARKQLSTENLANDTACAVSSLSSTRPKNAKSYGVIRFSSRLAINLQLKHKNGNQRSCDRKRCLGQSSSRYGNGRELQKVAGESNQKQLPPIPEKSDSSCIRRNEQRQLLSHCYRDGTQLRTLKPKRFGKPFKVTRQLRHEVSCFGDKKWHQLPYEVSCFKIKKRHQLYDSSCFFDKSTSLL